jgi:hypothetical protein
VQQLLTRLWDKKPAVASWELAEQHHTAAQSHKPTSWVSIGQTQATTQLSHPAACSCIAGCFCGVCQPLTPLLLLLQQVDCDHHGHYLARHDHLAGKHLWLLLLLQLHGPFQ